MKITIPENISEITLGQFQKIDAFLKKEGLTESQKQDKILSVYLDISLKDVSGVSVKDKDRIFGLIGKALSTTVDFQDRFIMNGVEFGFIPNFNKILTAEYTDFSLYSVDQINTWHNLMAILFRPISKKDALGNYSITKYKGTEDYSNIMKSMPMHIVDGAMVFFWSLAKELQISTQKSLQEALLKGLKQQTTLKNGAGMQQ